MKNSLRLIAFLLVALNVVPAQANDNVLLRLRSEPVTLFDWGLAQLDRDIKRVAQSVLPDDLDKKTTTKAGALFLRAQNQVKLYVIQTLPKSERSAIACRLKFQQVVHRLVDGTPDGPGRAGWYLLNAFQPKGHFWASRFEDVGKKLLNSVRLEVSLIPQPANAFQGDTGSINCAGSLDAEAHELNIDKSS